METKGRDARERPGITDAGEFLPGARKAVASDNDGLADGGSSGRKALKTRPIDAVWPMPDWVALVASGQMDAEAACHLYFIRKNLADEPPYDFNAAGVSAADWQEWYTRGLEAIAQAVEGVVTRADCNVAAEKYNTAMGWPGGKEPATKDNRRILPPYALGRTGGRSIKHPWGLRGASWYRSRYLHLLGWPTDPEVKENSKFLPCELTYSNVKDPVWHVGECCGSGFSVVGGRRENLETAIKVAREMNKAGRQPLNNGVPEYKEPKRPQLEGGGVRIGEDRRSSGTNVTSETLMETFGYRGLQWGEWVPQKERQLILNNVFDSSYDLMTMFGLSPGFASINGKIGLSFGARGQGFISAGTAAHFEPDTFIIHLTRLCGSGSFAHEWGHALDYFLGQAAKARFKTGDFFSEATDIRSWRDVLAPEKNPSCQAWLMILESMMMDHSRRQSDYRYNALLLGGGRYSYWSEPKEMFARAFEAAVYDRLLEDGRRNDYLVFGVEPDRFSSVSNIRGNPYPVGAERSLISRRIFEAMDILLFGAIRKRLIGVLSGE